MKENARSGLTYASHSCIDMSSSALSRFPAFRARLLVPGFAISCSHPTRASREIHRQRQQQQQSQRRQRQQQLLRISGPQAKIPRVRVTLFSFPPLRSLEPLRGCCCADSCAWMFWLKAQVLDKWIKTNIQRKAVKRQKDRAPLSQLFVRQRRPYYPYTPYLHRPLLHDSTAEGSGRHPTALTSWLIRLLAGYQP